MRVGGVGAVSKINDIEDVISFFLSSKTSDLALNLSKSLVTDPPYTSVSQVIGIITLAIADAKVGSKQLSAHPLYIDAFNMARKIIEERELTR
jgi:hypothetical protein